MKTLLIALLSIALILNCLAVAQIQSTGEGIGKLRLDNYSDRHVQNNIAEGLSNNLPRNNYTFKYAQRELTKISYTNGMTRYRNTSLFKWIGNDIDMVGRDYCRPDGNRDGHFGLFLPLPSNTEIKSILIYPIGPHGTRVGDDYWNTYDPSCYSYIIGVFNRGQPINQGRVSSLGIFPGDVQLDLYVSDFHGKPGDTFAVDVEFASGVKFHDLAIVGQNRSKNSDSSFTDSWNNFGVALIYSGNYREAIDFYDEFIASTPKSAIIWNNIGDSLYMMGNLSDALSCFNYSIELDQKDATAWSNKGLVFAGMGRYKDALNCYDKSLSIDSYNAEAWNGKGVTLAKEGDLKQALECFNNAAILKKNYTDAWYNGGLVLRELDQMAKSRDAFEKAGSTGYNVTMQGYQAQTEAQLMNEPGEKQPGFEGIIAAIALLAVSGFVIRKMKQ
jgi:tetratricopeptide (TPR) repeat protein